jgi:hypothetical protein
MVSRGSATLQPVGVPGEWVPRADPPMYPTTYGTARGGLLEVGDHSRDRSVPARRTGRPRPHPASQCRPAPSPGCPGQDRLAGARAFAPTGPQPPPVQGPLGFVVSQMMARRAMRNVQLHKWAFKPRFRRHAFGWRRRGKSRRERKGGDMRRLFVCRSAQPSCAPAGLISHRGAGRSSTDPGPRS